MWIIYDKGCKLINLNFLISINFLIPSNFRNYSKKQVLNEFKNDFQNSKKIIPCYKETKSAPQSIYRITYYQIILSSHQNSSFCHSLKFITIVAFDKIKNFLPIFVSSSPSQFHLISHTHFGKSFQWRKHKKFNENRSEE
jgi:hypothetical protein